MEAIFQIYLFGVTLLLLLLPVIDWTATIILHRATSRAPHENIALKERAKMAAVLATATTINGFLSFNRLADLNIESHLATVLLSISLILISVPNIYWLSLYLRNRLRK